MKTKKSNLKRIISSFGVGIASASAVIPVIACGEDENKDVILVPNTLANDLRKVTAHSDQATGENGFFENIPDVPDNSYWEYRIGADGQFSAEPPKNFVAGDFIAIKLVANQNYTLSAEVERNDIRAVGEVNTNGLQDDLNNLTAYINTTILKLPAAPGFDSQNYENSLTWWEYQVEGETTWKKTDSELDLSSYTLTVDEKVTVRLGVNEEFTISTDPVIREFIVKGKINTGGFQYYLENKKADGDPKPYDEYFYLQPDTTLRLPLSPEHSRWEYQLPDSPDWTELTLTPDPSNTSLGIFDTSNFSLQLGQKFGLRLHFDENYVSSTGKVEQIFPVVNVVDTNVIKTDFDKLVSPLVSTTSFELPDISGYVDLASWQYSIDDGATWQAAGTELTPDTFSWNIGQKFSVRLFLKENNRSSAGPIEKEFIIQEEINVPEELLEALTKTIVTVDQGVLNLPDLTTGPTKVDNTHWLFSINGRFIDHEPTPNDLKWGDEVIISLGPDNDGYFLNKTAVKTTLVSKVVNVPDSVKEDLEKVTATHEAGIVGLPDLTKVEHAHWEFSINEGTQTTKIPVAEDLKASDKVKITLVTDQKYVTTEIISKTVIATQDYEIPDANTFWEAFGNLSLTYPNYEVDIPNIPDGVPAHWEYQIDNGTPSVNPPANGADVGPTVKITFVVDANWKIAVPAEYENGREVKMEPFATDDPEPALNFDNVKATVSDTSADISGLPPLPSSDTAPSFETAYYLFSTDDGQTWEKAYPDTLPKEGETLIVKVVPTSYPNVIYKTPQQGSVVIESA